MVVMVATMVSAMMVLRLRLRGHRGQQEQQ